MLRPNLAQDAPPSALTVGGVDYPINTDYRVWIGVLRELRDLIPTPKNPEQVANNNAIYAAVEMTVFGKIIEQPMPAVFAAISEFAQGYPEPPVLTDGKYKAQTYSFDWDLNYIILAIRNQSGIDLSYRRKEPFHWWEFLLEFHSLCGDHYILRLMEIRGYDGKDPEMKRQAQRYALPREQTAEDQALADEFNDIFYNA